MTKKRTENYKAGPGRPKLPGRILRFRISDELFDAVEKQRRSYNLKFNFAEDEGPTFYQFLARLISRGLK